MPQRNIEMVKCSGCGHVFDAGAVPAGPQQLSDHPVRGGGPVDGAASAWLGVATVVAAKGPANSDEPADEWPAYVCPQCGQMN